MPFRVGARIIAPFTGDRVMTRQEVHKRLMTDCEELNGEMTRLIGELDRKPLDKITKTRIAKALNGST